jgi:hypothetical protein
MILWLAAEAPDPGAVLQNLPPDPARAWAIIFAVIFMAAAPVVKAYLDTKKSKGETKKEEKASVPSTSVVINESATPHIDASQQLLATVVGNLEERARQAEQKYDELERRHVELVRNVTRSELKVEMLEARVRDLENENSVLVGRLAER